MYKKVTVLLILFCLLVSFIYRNKFYWDFPPIADTFDEFASGWLGLSILRSGIPTSWSFIPDYQSGVPHPSTLYLVGTKLAINGIVPNKVNYSSFPKPLSLSKEFNLDGYRSQFNIVSPYLEQPPLGGILVSLPLYFSGVKEFSQTTLKTLRSQFVVLGVISTALVMLIAYLWYGKFVSIIAGFLYATVPTIVFGSRLALPENFLVLFFLLQIVILKIWSLKRNNIFLFVSLLIAFLAPLIKPFGLSITLFSSLYFILLKNYKLAFYSGFAGILSIVTYFIYGIGYDKNTFWMVWTYQTNRFFPGPITFLIKILVPKVTHIFLDGWIFFGWISIYILAFIKKERNHRELLIAFVSYVLGLIVFGGEDYGWYRLPIYPFLIIAASYIVVQIIKKPTFLTGELFVLTAITTGLQLGIGIVNWSHYLIYYRIFLILSSAIFGLGYISKRKYIQTFQSSFVLLILIISIYLNTRIINNARIIWQSLGDSSSLIMNRK